MTDEYQIDGKTHAEKDANGDIVHKPDVVNTERLFSYSNLIYQPTGGSGDGQDAPPASDPWTLDESELDGFTGRVALANGRWITDGLTTDDAEDWDQSPVYFDGEGVWASAIEHVDGTSPTIRLQGTEGNGGGVSNIAVYGAGSGVGTANIIETDTDIIDTVYENIIVRYGGGDALNVPGSGTRVINAWLENVSGNALNISGGTRPKAAFLHIIGADNGLNIGANRGQFVGFSMDGLDGDGISCSGNDNEFAHGVIRNVANFGINVSTRYNSFENIHILSPDRGIRASSGDNTFDNIMVRDAVSYAAYFDAKTVVNGLYNPTDDGVIVDTGSTETVINGLTGASYGSITDDGTRTLINGWGTNSGDPNTTGEWNGHVDYAGVMDASIYDTTTSPWTKYEPTPNGDWSAQ